MTNAIKAPLLNPNDPVATLAHWYVENGAHVKVGDALCDLTTSKAAFTVEAEQTGYIGALRAKQTKVRAGETLALLFDSASEAKAAQPTIATSQSRPVFSRKALSRLRASGLSEDDFLGAEFVTERDIERKLNGGTVDAFKEAEVALLAPAYREALRSSVTIRAVLQKARAKDFEQMFFAQAFWAHHVSQALAQHRRFLCTRQEDVRAPEPKEVDIGYAVNSGEGPRPFLAKRADTWSVNEWRENLTRWSLSSARGQVRPEELGCGRFSITDLSALGVWRFEPLLVGDQSAILAIGGDSEQKTTEFTLTLAFDHRMHDGRQAAEFLNFIRERAKT